PPLASRPAGLRPAGLMSAAASSVAPFIPLKGPEGGAGRRRHRGDRSGGPGQAGGSGERGPQRPADKLLTSRRPATRPHGSCGRDAGRVGDLLSHKSKVHRPATDTTAPPGAAVP